MYLVVLLPVVIFLLAYYIRSLQPSQRNLPPGPFVLPVVGSIPAIYVMKPCFTLTVAPWEYVHELGKRYGDLVFGTVLNYNAILLTSYEIHEEVANMEEYSIKFSSETITYPRTFGKELGLLFVGHAPLWTEMRKFTVRTLREFGFGKRYTMHGVIIDEASVMVDKFKKTIKETGGVVRFRNTFLIYILNVTWCMVAGVKYPPDHPKLQKLLLHMMNISKTATFSNPLEVVVPYVKMLFPMFFGAEMRNKVCDDVHVFCKEVMDERRAAGFYENDPQNYIDVFLQKIHGNRNDPDSVYTDEQLQSIIFDILGVSTLTSNGTFNYAVLYLALYPDIQRKIIEEIDSVAPKNNIPTLEDTQKMPWFQAFMLEVHRIASVVPQPIPRVTPKEWLLRGYKIPKGTVIISNHYSINYDEKIWGDPKAFRPARFINEKGQFVPDPRVTIFGFGKRLCIGIKIVESTFPLFFAMLLKNFTISVVPGTKPPSTEAEIGISLSPKEFPVLLTARDNPATGPV